MCVCVVAASEGATFSTSCCLSEMICGIPSLSCQWGICKIFSKIGDPNAKLGQPLQSSRKLSNSYFHWDFLSAAVFSQSSFTVFFFFFFSPESLFLFFLMISSFSPLGTQVHDRWFGAVHTYFQHLIGQHYAGNVILILPHWHCRESGSLDNDGFSGSQLQQ